MKKLIIFIMALAMVAIFLPQAEAGDTANLGLSVSFKLEPLKLWAEPSGPFVINEGQEVKFKVIAEDLDAKSVTLTAGELPKGATFVLVNYWAPTNHMEGTFTWTPAIGYVRKTPYAVEFKATSSNQDTGLGMIVKITVEPQLVISIELNPTTWALDGVKLGESIGGVFGIANVGNVSVLVDIGYGPQIDKYPPVPSVRPGLRQGKDTFITEVVSHNPYMAPSLIRILPPDRRMKLTSINPSEKAPLDLVYGAPTELSQGIKDHGVTYELRAYGDIVPIDEPLPIIKQ